MGIETRFPFYDKLQELIEPYSPMIVNDLTDGLLELIIDGELYDEEEGFVALFEEELERNTSPEVEDEFEHEVMVAFSFTRGFLPDTEINEYEHNHEDCDYEIVIKPFFTVKPFILIGIHNNKTKVFHAEISDEPTFQSIELLEKLSIIIQNVFPDETLDNKIFLLTNMAFTAIEELTQFDEPVNEYQGDIMVQSSPYFELDNPPLHEYLMKKQHRP